jgi:hypothetical protein
LLSKIRSAFGTERLNEYFFGANIGVVTVDIALRITLWFEVDVTTNRSTSNRRHNGRILLF